MSPNNQGEYIKVDQMANSNEPDIVITKSEVQELKKLSGKGYYDTDLITREMPQEKKRWSILSCIAFLFGVIALVSGILSFSSDKIHPDRLLLFIASFGGCIIAILVGAISLATFHENSSQKGLLLSFIGMGCGITGLVLTVIPFHPDSNSVVEGVKLNMKEITETVRNADPRIRVPLMANVHIKSNSGFSAGMGSGIALCNYDLHTYILTNVHVLTLGAVAKDIDELKRKAKNIEVTFYTGEKVKGIPVWMAPDSIDMALVRVITPKGFKPMVKYQRKRPLFMGQRVFAIGNPMDLNCSYTDGVVSGLRKNKCGSREITVIQMQTPLNHGNSGGGLYDTDGYLIGLNTWIYAKVIAEGLNFSIAIDEFFNLLEPDWIKIIALSNS